MIVNSKKKLYIYYICIASCLLFLIHCSRSDKKGIASMIAKKGSFEITIPSFGELQAVKATPIAVPSQVRSRQTIAWLLPENSLVKKGQTLIRLDANQYHERIQKQEYNIKKLNLEINDKKRLLQKEKSQLKGQLKITTIEKEMADVYAARDESIYPKIKIIEDAVNLDYLNLKTRHYKQKGSKLDMKARAELQLLELKRRTHQVKVDQYKAALDSLEIKAPHDGLFIYQKSWRGDKPRLGMSTWGGRKLGKIPNLKEMEAKIFILESEASGLKKDLPVTLILDSKPETPINGKISAIDTIAKPLEQESPLKYFEVKVSLKKTDTSFMKPGNQLKATVFVQQMKDVISVPNQAIFFEQENGNELSYVNIKTSSSHRKQLVEIGIRSLTRTVITGNLKEGERILLGNPKE
jgi:HlyD family secretion protein